MKAVLRRRLEMATRVRDFLRAHRTDGVPEQAALAAVLRDDAVEPANRLQRLQAGDRVYVTPGLYCGSCRACRRAPIT